MDQAIQALSERLERLERENSRIKRTVQLMKIAMASAVALCLAIFSVPKVQSKHITGQPLISAQQIELVDASGRVLASLGPTSDGNVLTFFDSAGKKTMTLGDNATECFAGLTTWDNNNVIPGNGVVRTSFGESNQNCGGFSGAVVLDGNEKPRTVAGLSFDLKTNSLVALDANGTATGVGIFPSSFAGYFANDANGTTRQFGGLSLDGKSNLWAEADTGGQLRLLSAQNPDDTPNSEGRIGNGFVIRDSNGQQRAAMFAFTDDSLAGFNVVDKNNRDRFEVNLRDQDVAVNLFNAAGGLGLDAYVDNAGLNSNFAVSNTNGKIIAQESVNSDGASGAVRTLDSTGTTITGHLP